MARTDGPPGQRGGPSGILPGRMSSGGRHGDTGVGLNGHLRQRDFGTESAPCAATVHASSPDASWLLVD